MKLKEAIGVLLDGGDLEEEAKAQLRELDPEGLLQELSALRKEKEEAENAKLSSEELLQKQLNEALAERDTLRQEQSLFKRRERVRQLAAESGCEDPEYLDFAAQKGQVNLDDEAASAEFLKQLEAKSPHCFRAKLLPGGGTGGVLPAERGEKAPVSGDRIGRIMEFLSSNAEQR